MSGITILFVDDEINILRAMERVFLDEEYEVLSALSGKEALATIENGAHPAIIVSDQNMPGMTGAEFLRKTRRLLPDSVRIILSGHADINSALDAINLGGVYRFILKPWVDEDLKQTVREAVRQYRLISENHRLTEELQSANLRLEELNTNLEAGVRERIRELAIAYEVNLKLTADLQKKIRELQGWDRIQKHLLAVHPLEETLQVIVEVVRQVSAADGVRIYLYSAGQISLAKSDGIEWRRETWPGEAAVSETAIARCRKVVDSGQPLFLSPEEGESEMDGMGSVLLPIVKYGRTLGVLQIFTCQESIENDGELLQILGNFSIQAATAIQDSSMNHSMDELESSLEEIIKNIGPMG